jgi:predicted acetyltransferase
VIEIRTPDEADYVQATRLDGRVFGEAWSDEEVQRELALIDLTRHRVAVDGGTVVGAAGSYPFELTMPGGAFLRTGGVSFVFVGISHRRQGVLGRLMEAVHRDIDEREEPLAALTASEAGIYERFGYGVATIRRVTSIDRSRARFLPRFEPERASLRIVDHEDPALLGLLAERWDRFRRLQVGELDRPEKWLRFQIQNRGPSTTWLLHDDGFASWKVAAEWNEGHPAHDLELFDLAAATPEAHVALWHAVLSVDLVGSIRSRIVAPDEPLPFLLEDPRALRTVELNDLLWLFPRDVAACFATRTYGTEDELVVESDGRRWRVGSGGVRRVRSRPDLRVERSALGPLLLGGVAPTTLAAGRRLEARSSELLHRADLLFLTQPRPHTTTGF